MATVGRECIFDINSTSQEYRKGLVEGPCDMLGKFLNDGRYYFKLFYYEECLSMEVEGYRINMNWYGKWSGYVRPKFPFRMGLPEFRKDFLFQHDPSYQVIISAIAIKS